jgi:hypothetical protein
LHKQLRDLVGERMNAYKANATDWVASSDAAVTRWANKNRDAASDLIREARLLVEKKAGSEAAVWRSRDPAKEEAVENAAPTPEPAAPPAPAQSAPPAAAQAAPAEDFELSRPTPRQVVDQAQAAADETRAEAARRRVRDEQERKDRERRDIAARMDASAENFQLGQNAQDALSGQDGLFQSRAAPDPFTAGYPALDGRKVKFQVLIADTGQTATFTVDAGQHMRDLDDRRDVARRLAECVNR